MIRSCAFVHTWATEGTPLHLPRHWVPTALFLAATLYLAASCTGRSESPADSPPPLAGPGIYASGSGTAMPLFERQLAAFRADDPGVAVSLLPGTSTGGAVQGVRRGVLQLGLCSRRLTPEEEALGLRYHLLGYDLVVFAAHPSARVTELSREALLGIYAGRVRSWSEVGGAQRGIVLLDRDEGESLKVTLRRHFFGPDLAITPQAAVFVNAEDMAEALRTTPYSLGYAGRAELRARGLDAGLIPPLGRWP
ncbi:MAG: substrate-binding domain-containing protein, partial [Deferrisomatales bacterium]